MYWMPEKALHLAFGEREGQGHAGREVGARTKEKPPPSRLSNDRDEAVVHNEGNMYIKQIKNAR
jgi:hypothetical protein